jgi:Spx/MgsR family transcriptional regulator
MKLYGIKTCGSVRKAIKFFKENDIEFEFIDFKKEEIKQDKIDAWLQKVSINKLFNNKGTKYRTLKLKDLNLDDDEKAKWLAKENMLIKRPVIEYKDSVIVAFDEEEYKKLFFRNISNFFILDRKK